MDSLTLPLAGPVGVNYGFSGALKNSHGDIVGSLIIRQPIAGSIVTIERFIGQVNRHFNLGLIPIEPPPQFKSAGTNPPTKASPRPTVVAFDWSTWATGRQHILWSSNLFNASVNTAPSRLGERFSMVW